MKTFKFKMIGMAMIAAFMTINFVSCSKELPGGDLSNEKKLVKMEADIGIYNFAYDSKGRLTTVSSVGYDGYHWGDLQYTWGDDVITVYYNDYAHGDGDDSYSYTLTLKDGLVSSSSIGDTFAYNDSGRITQWHDYDVDRTIRWDGDKVVNIGFGDESTTFTYGTSCQKGYYAILPKLINYHNLSNLLFIAHPEIAGMQTKHLPTEIDSQSWIYEFDKDGYISKIKYQRYDKYVEYCILTWE